MIYLDCNATTPVDPRVVEAMVPVMCEQFANPSSSHRAGRAVAAMVETARERVAALVGVRRREVVFTSGATEAANLAIRGILAGGDPNRRRVLVAASEHHSVLGAATAASESLVGSRVDHVRVHHDGTVDLAHLDSLLDHEVALVAVMHSNNETGVVNDIAPVAQLVHGAGAVLLSDVTQSVGKVPVRLAEWDVDLALLSAHKLYGPKGVGALAVRVGLRSRLVAQLAGGGQERGLRSGTVNSAGVVGFGRAAELAVTEGEADAARCRGLVAQLEAALHEGVGEMARNGPATRLPNTTNLWFPRADADSVMTAMPGVAVSSGSACRASETDPSHVLTAMGLPRRRALESLRFSVGRMTTEDEVLRAAALVTDAVEHVRLLSAREPRSPSRVASGG
jgi:cysteine desulfurase